MNLTPAHKGRPTLVNPRRAAAPHVLGAGPAAAVTGIASPGDEGDRDRNHPRIGRIVVASMAAGVLAAAALAAAPFVPADEEGVTGAALLGFALGWALLAALSIRSSEPQLWAIAPALFLGLAGVVVVVAPTAFVHDVLAWVWPPALLVLVSWTFVQARRRLRSRTRRWMLNPVLVLLALSAVGAGFETARESLDASAYPMPGELVDVGGHRMHLSCTGSGSPTVVLEPGAGEMSSSLGWIAPAVARDTRVCVYDRAGRGWSEPADGRQDAARIASDLHTLLHLAGVPGPYVLVGHSFGGLYALTYAAHFPDDVAGMILVDSTAPADHASPTTGSGSYDALGRVSAAMSAAARLGLVRLVAPLSYVTLPPQSRAEARASMATASQVGSTVDEYAAAGASMDQARSLVDFAGKPLVVLTAGSGSSQEWFAKQDRLANLSTNSLHRVVAGATHASLLEHEQDAAAVSRAIHEVVTSLRAASPLPTS